MPEKFLKMPRFEVTTKGKKKLVDDLHNYYNLQKFNANKSKIYWKCSDRSCSARASTTNDLDTPTNVTYYGNHVHAARNALVSASAKLQDMKVRSTNTHLAPRSIISNIATTTAVHTLEEMPQTDTISRSIRRWRKKDSHSPPTPQNRFGYTIPDEFRTLANGQNFLKFDSGANDLKRILLFASDDGIDLKSCRNWAADGTFKCSPTIFYQLFIIHIQDKEVSIPRAFALLPDKTEDSYTRLFKKVKELVGVDGYPNNIMLDFEKAIHNAIHRRSIFSCEYILLPIFIFLRTSTSISLTTAIKSNTTKMTLSALK